MASLWRFLLYFTEHENPMRKNRFWQMREAVAQGEDAPAEPARIARENGSETGGSEQR